MAFFSKPKYSTVVVKNKKDIPENLYTSCPISGEIVYNKELEKNLMVVPKSGYHFPLKANQRIKSIIDENTFQEYDREMTSIDMLNFEGYKDKLVKDQKKSGMFEAVISGIGKIGEITTSLGVMDFRFQGASMGSVVGEKITRTIERAVEMKCPLVIVTASGGARMQEGILSLMQMAKTSAALAKLNESGLPYISILTNPTYGGVSASFGSLGDIILAEPRALIGFAGKRVIKEGTKEELPDQFQTAEFLLEHGLLDQIVPRNEIRSRLISLLHALYVGKEPFNGKNN